MKRIDHVARALCASLPDVTPWEYATDEAKEIYRNAVRGCFDIVRKLDFGSDKLDVSVNGYCDRATASSVAEAFVEYIVGVSI